MRFFLLGFMGVGKSTLGRRAAERLVIPFVDLDEWIEDKHGKTVSDIFRESGERFFRAEETNNLLEVIKSYEQFIMATGGGLPCHGSNLDIMNEHGTTIYLRAPAQQLFERLVRSSAKRPLLADQSQQEKLAYVQKLLNDRDPIYSQAHRIFDVDLTRSKTENTLLLIDLIKADL